MDGRTGKGYSARMIETLADFPAIQAIQRALWQVSDVRGAAVMVGSGFSLNAELPSPASKAPPLWWQMAQEMERQIGSGSSGGSNPLRLAEEYRALLGQAALDGLVRDLVRDAEWLPGSAHRRLLELPWSDVLTTNWDTLLERAKADLAERSYDVVLTPADIGRTRSPRIVKLHGSLPSHTPFIFAEEDYRTYPTRFAPFVNLAQHVLLENELLLLGFSGDDPNFLNWAGWVRDQLGASARRIRLAGILDLSPARRRYLENLNVTPIDLAPLAAGVEDPRLRHSMATTALLDAMHGAKPRPIHVWARIERQSHASRKDEGAADQVVRITREWIADREAAPGWLVAPGIERSRLRMDTADAARGALSRLGEVSAEQRHRFAAELAWRLDIGQFGVPEWAKRILEAPLSEEPSGLSPQERTRLRAILARQAIEDREFARVDALVDDLEADGADDEAPAWAAYLKGLGARDRLDLAGIVAALPLVKGSDPVWLFRRAALMCAAFDPEGAAKLVRDGLIDIRRRRTLDRRSLWLLSREAWGRFLWRNLAFELRKDEDDRLELGEDWPLVYDEHRIDPWDELNVLDYEIRQEQESRRKWSGAEKIHFEPGSWTPAAKEPAGRFAEWVVPSEMQVRRLADDVGIPWRAGSADVLSTRLARTVSETTERFEAAAVWRVASYLRSEDGELMDSWFGRTQVAALPEALVAEIASALRTSVEYLASTTTARDTNSVEALRTLLELLSRLAVRADPKDAKALFKLALSTFDRVAAEHWWLFKATTHLINRALSAIPPAERGGFVGDMLAFPLPGERKSGAGEREWPEFSDAFRPSAVVVRRPESEWDARIAGLIAIVGNDRREGRHRAIQRLWLLRDKDVLTQEETGRFAQAVWSWRRSPAGLPKDVSFYPGAMVQLPEPQPGEARTAFNHEVVQPILRGEIEPGLLESLSYVGSEADKGRAERPFTAIEATELIRAIPWPEAADGRELAASAISFGLLPIAKLDDNLAEELWQRSTGTDAAAGILFLPHVAIHFPERAGGAAAKLERAMKDREFAGVNIALNAVRNWARLANAETFPASLTTAIVSLVAVRREPGLFRTLDVCVELVDHELLTDEDARRILEGLEELLIETDYRNWRYDGLRAATHTYVRANAVRLAKALRRSGRNERVIENWISAGSTDPTPEVRYVTEDHD